MAACANIGFIGVCTLSKCIHMGNKLIDSAVGGSLASAAASGFVGLLSNGAGREYEYQKKLMALQNQYNQQNAAIAYNRSRDLTKDTAMLEKMGKQQAGINTAFGQDGNVASASSAPQADGTSIPSPVGIMQNESQRIANVQASVNSLIQAAQAKSQIALTDSQKENQDIKNVTQMARDMASVKSLNATAAKDFANAAYQNILNKYADSRASSESSSAASKAVMDGLDASVRGFMNDVDYQNKLQDLDNKKRAGLLTAAQYNTEVKKLAVMNSQINANNAQAEDSRSHVNVNTATAAGLNLDNKLKTLTFSDKLVESFENAEQSKLRTLGMKLQNLPKSISESFTRSALFALERIQKGHGSGADYALVASQTAREALDRGNAEAKDWAKILLGVLPMSSSGSAQTNSYSVSGVTAPQYR